MVGVVSSIPTGGNFIFANFETPCTIVYNNARNVKFVLFRKNSIEFNLQNISRYPCSNMCSIYSKSKRFLQYIGTVTKW